MTAFGIAKPIDVIGYVRGRHVPTVVDALLDLRIVQTAEEGLGDRVVPAVGGSAPAWLQMITFAKAPPCIIPILGAQVRVDQGLAWPSTAYGFHNGFENKRSMNRRPHSPANKFA